MNDDVPDRDLMHLDGELRGAWVIIQARMEHAGHPMRLVEGRRSSSRQAHIYAQGRTRPGPIVTRARPGTGKHEPGPDGLGRAIDCAFMGPEPYGEQHPWELYGEHCEAQGLEWGGRWKHPDRPHAQMRAKTTPTRVA
jgi:peptidoglycan L-alanyl-D-glutamate endopeptidase CwlK